MNQSLKEVAGRLACSFARPEKCAGAHKALYDALVRSYHDGVVAGRIKGMEEARAIQGAPGFSRLEQADWSGVVAAGGGE